MLSVAARPKRRPILKTAAALFRRGADAVLYGFLAVCWAHSLYGIAVEILTCWVYGKGSAAEAIGATVCAACWFVMVRLFPVIFPLILMRIIEHAEFVEERERRRYYMIVCQLNLLKFLVFYSFLLGTVP
jgi:hypothetical protein